MKRYILYILVPILNLFPVALFWGASFSRIAFAGFILLYSIAIPVYIYHQKRGLIVAIIALALMLPYSFRVLGAIVEDRFTWDILLIIIPASLIIISIYYTAAPLVFRTPIREVRGSANSKQLLAAIPIVMLLIYFIIDAGFIFSV